jgi:outer membrane protein TolC
VIFTEGFNVTDNPVFALMNIINQRQLEVGTDFNHPGQKQNFSSRIQGEWSLFEGGSRWHDRKAADYQMRSVEAELLAARNRLVATVTETYYRWLQALDFIAVSGRTDAR